MNDAGRAYLGQRLDAVENALNPIRAARRIPGQERAQGENLFGLKAQFDVEQARERAQEEACSYQEHDGQSHFANDERGSKPLLPAIAADAPSVALERSLQIQTREAPGRRKAEGNRSQQAEQRREAQHSDVQRHVFDLPESDGVLGQENQRPAGPHAQQQPERASQHGQRQALDEQLLDEAPAARAE